MKLLAIDPNSMPKNTNYTLGEGGLVYKCKTNLEAKFLWKVCRSIHPDVWHEKSYEISCKKMLKNQSHYCKDIKPNAITKNDYYYADNGVMGYFSQLFLDHVQQPHEGCILCTAVRNYSVVNAFTYYKYREKFRKNEKKTAENKIAIYITVAALVAVLFLALAVKFIRDFIFLLKKLQVFKYRRCHSLEESNIQNVFLKDDIYVMIVYPHGCGILEELVFALGKIMCSKGINVLVDIFQPQRETVEGLAGLLKDFEKADYVVVLCTEPMNSPYENHNNYKFVLDLLLNSQVMDKNSKSKYIAVYFDNGYKFVPRYLYQRKYFLPSLLDLFLLNLYGIQTHFSTIFSKILKETPEIAEQKRKFCLLCKKFKDGTHIDCNSNFCIKAKSRNSSLSSSLNCYSFEAPSNSNHAILQYPISKSRNSSISSSLNCYSFEAPSNSSTNDEDLAFQNNLIKQEVFLKKEYNETSV
ncbi:uncharacterized protein LOC136088525 isoform X2 [Hydra vulgaris]|uniref:Uncharacterized protein LOC136088525 isoform X2 n=1 Tax=Hydra vulgaris TaxID=6087 RepID=A0ABM4D2G6_HYDVU